MQLRLKLCRIQYQPNRFSAMNGAAKVRHSMVVNQSGAINFTAVSTDSSVRSGSEKQLLR